MSSGASATAGKERAATDMGRVSREASAMAGMARAVADTSSVSREASAAAGTACAYTTCCLMSNAEKFGST